MRRNEGLDPASIGDVILGCANQAGRIIETLHVWRVCLQVLPYTVPGETVNRLCASGLAAATNASRMLALGDADVVIVGGVENMTRGPWVMSKASKPFGRDSKLYDSSFGWRFINPKLEAVYGVDGMGVTAENLVAKYGISREDQDAFAYASQMKAKAARDAGLLAEEIIPVAIPRRKQEDLIFAHDEFIRDNTTLDVLSTLRQPLKMREVQ